MSSPARYYFQQISHCVMCGDDTRHHSVLGLRLNQSQGFTPRAKRGIATTVVKCRRCHLIYSNPQPVPFDIQDHYGMPPEDYWKPAYFHYDPGYFSQEIARLRQLMVVTPGMKALDIGAGLGKCMISLNNAGFDTFGFEVSESFHRRAISQMKIDPARLKLGALESVDYDDHSFDFITFSVVLEHLYDPAASIEKAMRWLKPGGLMHIEVPSSSHLLAKLINSYYRLIGTTYITNLSPMHPPYHLYEFDLRSFEEHARISNRYTVLFHEYYVCSIEPFPRFVRPFLSWMMKRTNTGMQLAVWLQKKV